MIIWLLATWSLTFLARSAKITARPRRWLKLRSKFIADLLSCPFCTAIWAAAFLAILAGPWPPTVAEVLFLTLAGAAFSAAFDAVVVALWSASQLMDVRAEQEVRKLSAAPEEDHQ